MNRSGRRPADDCFALPPGVHWTPVAEALERLEAQVEPIVGREEEALARCAGRIASSPLIARRAAPAASNSAVDGYAYCASSLDGSGSGTLARLEGSAAAGHPWSGNLPAGCTLRILTGAPMPKGADTVVLQEDVEAAGDTVRILRAPRPGANVRAAGEDLKEGMVAVEPGRRIRPQDLAQAAAAGAGRIEVFRKLRVGVLSTGDELRHPEALRSPEEVADANRPMLIALAESQGFEVVDLGVAADRADTVRASLDRAAETCDALVTSGGASGGDEDHLSRILAAEGRMHVWRIAVKPGRPLAMGSWRGVQVCGLPGNPVAAFVCFLIFARPVLLRLAGSTWVTPRRFAAPISKALKKRPGRHEFLRARVRPDGTLERFHSEGSGLIGGLRWSDGLIELESEVTEVEAGNPVSFLPYSEFGIAS